MKTCITPLLLALFLAFAPATLSAKPGDGERKGPRGEEAAEREDKDGEKKKADRPKAGKGERGKGKKARDGKKKKGGKARKGGERPEREKSDD